MAVVVNGFSFSHRYNSHSSRPAASAATGALTIRRTGDGVENQSILRQRISSSAAFMVISSPDDIDKAQASTSETTSTSTSSSASPSTSKQNLPKREKISNVKNVKIPSSNTNIDKKKRRKKYKRKRPRRGSEEEYYKMRKSRQAKYEDLRKDSDKVNLWDFESLFPDPVWDYESIQRDLFEVSDRDAKNGSKKDVTDGMNAEMKGKGSDNGNTSLKKEKQKGKSNAVTGPKVDATLTSQLSKLKSTGVIGEQNVLPKEQGPWAVNSTEFNPNSTKIDLSLTRMVEDRLYGFRRDSMGEFQYDTSLMGEGAVKFRDGVRLGNALKVNADRLTYHARKELAKGKLEEAEELYERAVEMAPRDGRAYLGLSRIAQRRRDFKYARDCLKSGIANSFADGTTAENGVKVNDAGANPYLLQALGTLEERMGHLSEAERLYIEAARSRPSHAAAWVALAQLRTRKLRQGPNAGRMCYQTAEIELKRAGLQQSSHVYTSWAALEWKNGEIRKARDLFRKALEIDPKCSAAWNQLGVMETNEENWSKAEECFEAVLKYDRRNSRVLQAYAIMETKRPDADSRRAIGLFERALKANPRDGGVLQAYGIFVAKLGDIDAARDLFKKGTQIDKRHAPLWQAWGVLETRHGTASAARDIFQQGIWSCAQSSGGQSGGRRCARLWQAWGVLESKENDYAAARRCFSRALDADNRNVATVTAWTLMEEQLGKYNDAKVIFERALRQFGPQSEEKLSIWRSYELMELQAGNLKAAQSVYQRSIRDSMGKDDYPDYKNTNIKRDVEPEPRRDDLLKQSKSNEVEVSRWNSRPNTGFGENAEIWLNDGSIEGKVPSSTMKKKSQKPKK